MPYCHHCGTKNEKDATFCKRCAKKIGVSIEEEKSLEPKNNEDYVETPEKKKGKKWFIVGGVIIIVAVAIFLFIKYNPNILGGVIGIDGEKEACPYECCLGEDYIVKPCPKDYECERNYCVAIDSDDDGLTDIEERNIGTDPFDKNTDNDRYDDKEDPSPTKPNSAKITSTISNEKGDYHYLNMIKDSAIIMTASVALGACTAGTFGACAAAIPTVGKILGPILEDTVYTKTFDVSFLNQGDDYTSYLNYDVSYYIGPERLKTFSDQIEKLEINGNRKKYYSHDIKIEDIQYGRTWNLIFGKEEITIQIENVNYEQF